MNTSLQINFVPENEETSSDDSKWLKLEQFEYPDVVHTLNFSDIYAMFINAQQGLSAYAYLAEDCPITLTDTGAIIALDFYVFVSEMGLPYSLSASIGDLGRESISTFLNKEFDLIFPLSKSVDLEYIIENIELEWLLPPRTAKNQRIHPYPTITIDQSIAKSSQSMFAVLRAKGQAPCYLHTLLITIEKFTEDENGNRTVHEITNFKPAITATWTKEDGTVDKTILELKMPKCVLEFLEFCPNGTIKGVVGIERDNRLCTVYYNACTGNHLMTYCRDED